MKNIVCSFLIAFVCSACTNKKADTSSKDLLHSQLQKVINNNINDVSHFFVKNALLFYNTDQVYKGAETIAKTYKKLFNKKIDNIVLKHRTDGSTFFYEIGEYITGSKKTAFLCKWIKQDSNWIKEFEALSEVSASADDFKAIKKVKNKAIAVSQKKDNGKTIPALYSKNGYYYTKEQLYRGHKEIIETWYPGTRFDKIDEIAYIQVKTNLVYEIGKYEASGFPGLYILIWVKENGLWKVYLDSNV